MHKKSVEAAATLEKQSDHEGSDDDSDSAHSPKAPLSSGSPKDNRAVSIATLRAMAQEHQDKIQHEFQSTGVNVANFVHSMMFRPPPTADAFDFSHTIGL